MLTMRFICFKTMEFSTYICSIAGTKFVRSSRVFVSICGESHQVLHLCGVSPRATSWLRILRLSHSPLNPDYKHYRLCSCGLSQTETHILLECGQTRAPRQVMLNSIINILLKEQMFTSSQLNGLIRKAIYPQIFSTPCHFVLQEAVSQTKCYCSLKVKRFVIPQNFGLATTLRMVAKW